jgi:hypothetical protein
MSKRISLFTTKYGHQSIADTIKEHLDKKGYQVTLNLDTSKTLHLYTPFYLFFPQLFKVPYKLGEYDQAQSLIRKISRRSYLSTVELQIQTQQPDIVISTWYLQNPVLELLQPQYHYRFINIVSDPRTFHSFIPSKAAINFLFDDVAVERCQKLGIPPEQTIKSGWFVRPQYYQSYQPGKVKRSLAIDPQDVTFLVAAGSEGTNLILKILPAFLTANKPLTVFFACGHNRRLASLIKHTQRLNRFSNPQVKLIPLGYTNQLHRYIQAADLVIGKAGPNLLFETVAALTPFHAITHITGQEDGNLDLINQYQLGFVEENIVRANQLIQAIIENPNLLNQFQPSLAKLANFNRQAATVLEKTLTTL